MVDASLPARIAAIETTIMGGLKDNPTGQNWRLQLGGDQWSIVLEALRRYQAESLKNGSASARSPIDGTAP
jgi:hypothetical protein